MIIAKNLRDFRKSQTSGGRSCHCQLIFQSSSMRQSSSTGPARNCSSSSERSAGAKAFGGGRRECPALFGELGRREGQKLPPIGIAGEQLGIPPPVAGLDGFALGVGQARQRVLRQAEDRLGEVR